MITSSAYALYAGMLAIMFEITSPLRCSWWASAYSGRQQLHPMTARRGRSCRCPSPSAVRTCSTSSTNRSISHSVGVVRLVAEV